MNMLLMHLNECIGTGIEATQLTLTQLVTRAFIVFPTMYLMVRIAGRRFMAQKNSFDVVLAFLVASMLARAINGSAAFWANIALGFTVAIVYRLIAWLACEFPSFGALLKGRAIEVVIDGKTKLDRLRRHHVSMHDLEEDLRLAGNVGNAEEVKLARLERSGDISVERQPQIVRLSIEAGVQIIELRIK